MTDHHLVPDDDLTQPARQGEVPDWFATPEDAKPIVNPDEQAVTAQTPGKPAADSAAGSANDAATPGIAEPAADERSDEESDEASEPVADGGETAGEGTEGTEDVPVVPPVGTRRRRPGRPRPVPVASPPTGRGYGCADVITAIFLLLTVLSVSATVLLIANPRSPLNPFPAPTYPAILVLPSPLPTDTPTETFTPEPPTATVATPTPSATPTRTPTATPTVTSTPVLRGGTIPTATTTARAATQPLYTQSPFPFTVKPLKYTSNNTKEGCDWQSIAGTVSDLANKPIKGLAIRVAGSNGNIDEVHYSGTELRFGESGFEVFLGAKPRVDQYTIQLLGRTGTPISDTITIETRDSCDENVVLVNFVQNHAY